MLSFEYDGIGKKDSQKRYSKISPDYFYGGFVARELGSLFEHAWSMKEKIIFWLQELWFKIKLGMRKLKPNLKSKRFWYRFFLVFMGILLAGTLGTIALFAWYSKDLPSPTQVVRQNGFSTQIYDRNGNVIYDLYKDAKRIPVTSDQIPDYLKKATVSVEDKSFYQHQGIDPLTPLRILKGLIVDHKLVGGSTLTQQLVKNVLLTSDRTVTRKIKEFILAVQIESKYSKDQIITMYLNEAPYGGSAWGVGAAAQQYFNKDVKDLTLAESVILAGLPQLPNVYSPFSSTPTAYIARTQHVVDRMVEDGYLNKEQADETMQEVKDYKFYQDQSTLVAPHFVFWIKDQLAQKYGEDMVDGGGLKVTTTLDLGLQQQVEDIVSSQVDTAGKLGVSNGAAVVVDPTNGQVLAMVGSRGYNSTKTDGKFNVVTDALRQPGSAIKPVTYLTALMHGYTAATMVMDTPVTFPGTAGQPDYSPDNYTGKFTGPMSIRNALGNSINTVAVKMLANVGIQDMLTQANAMGLTTLAPTPDNLKRFGLAVTLGGGEVRMIDLARAYSSFANQGKLPEIIGILKVEDKTGKVLEQYRDVDGPQVMTPQEAFIIDSILMDNSARQMTFGAKNSLIIPNYQVAVKTGTTNDKRDNWAIGWTPNILVAAWVGNNDNTPMGKIASGVSGATPIWRDVMLASLPHTNKMDFPIPDKIVNIQVDNVSGYPAHDNFPSHSEYFIDGTQPTTPDPYHLQLKVCKDGSNGLATPQDVANNNFNSKEYFNLTEDDPVSTDGKNRWQDGINTWISQQPNQDMYHPPTNYCNSGNLIAINFNSPSDQSTVGSSVDIKVDTTSVYKITELDLLVDGVQKQSWSDKPFEATITLSDGPHDLQVKAKDQNGNTNQRDIHIGVNSPWNPSPTPTIGPTVTPTSEPVTPTITVVPSLTPTGIGVTH